MAACARQNGVVPFPLLPPLSPLSPIVRRPKKSKWAHNACAEYVKTPMTRRKLMTLSRVKWKLYICKWVSCLICLKFNPNFSSHTRYRKQPLKATCLPMRAFALHKVGCDVTRAAIPDREVTKLKFALCVRDSDEKASVRGGSVPFVILVLFHTVTLVRNEIGLSLVVVSYSFK